MVHIKLDFTRAQGHCFGCDLRNYALAEGTSNDRVSYGNSNTVDIYEVGGVAVAIGTDRDCSFVRGAIIGGKESAEGLVKELKLSDYVED